MRRIYLVTCLFVLFILSASSAFGAMTYYNCGDIEVKSKSLHLLYANGMFNTPDDAETSLNFSESLLMVSIFSGDFDHIKTSDAYNISSDVLYNASEGIGPDGKKRPQIISELLEVSRQWTNTTIGTILSWFDGLIPTPSGNVSFLMLSELFLQGARF